MYTHKQITNYRVLDLLTIMLTTCHFFECNEGLLETIGVSDLLRYHYSTLKMGPGN